MSNKQIISLYEHYKNTPKKLKIVCDWDEVIQAHESYAWYEVSEPKDSRMDFKKYFYFWGKIDSVEYSSYGSCLKIGNDEIREKEKAFKNSPNFYEEAPFLTIAEDLLKLIKEDKVERLIFLSAYDKRKFPNGDPRKIKIFEETFGKVGVGVASGNNMDTSEGILCAMKLILFDSETQGANKADWIKENASDFDLVIDNNPNICKSLVGDSRLIVKSKRRCEKCITKTERDGVVPLIYCPNCPEIKVLAPYYPVVVDQHHKEVLFIKQEVSDLKKEDFK
jgi:hypothetical protein